MKHPPPLPLTPMLTLLSWLFVPGSFGADPVPIPVKPRTAALPPALTTPGTPAGALPVQAGPARGWPSPPEPTSGFARFDLDFPGGPPAALVRQIQQATGMPLNVIIPTELAHIELPPLKMKGVTVPQLFEALNTASRKTVRYTTGTFQTAGGLQRQYQQGESSFGFRNSGNQAPTQDTVWHFFRIAPTTDEDLPEPMVCRFFNLATHLGTYQIEDITTAIQTSYKMLGDTNPPVMTFHKDTKLLIAVGNPAKLKLIETMLEELTGKQPEANPTRKRPPNPSKSADPGEP